jgi:F-type H+-transporting ATPase subunit b
VLSFVTSAAAQTDHAEPAAGDAHAATETHAETEAQGAGHGVFPPFDPATFGSQLFWLIVIFGGLYLHLSRKILPRVGGILENRDQRIAGDLSAAARLKQETDAAIAAYEQALAEARQSAHGIAQEARDKAKAEIDADRRRIEGDLQGRLEAADARIGDVKARALSDVDAIAKDAAEAMVEVLIGAGVARADVAKAVEAALAERA